MINFEFRGGHFIIGKKWNKKQDWFWEGNVQEKIVEYIEKKGFKITEKANTETKKQGPDIKILKGGKYEVIEVKGYPSDKYAINSPGGKIGETKKTKPRIQARHWFSQALFKIILEKCYDPDIEIALGFPYNEFYKNMIKRIKWLRAKLEIYVYLVKENGEIKHISPTE